MGNKTMYKKFLKWCSEKEYDIYSIKSASAFNKEVNPHGVAK